MDNYYKEHKKGIIGTIIFHAIIVTIFVFLGYSTPLPLPDEEGILINFGNSDEGFGQIEPKISETIQEQSSVENIEAAPETATPVTDGSITQDYEEAPAVKEQGKIEKTEITKPEAKPEIKKEEKKEVIKERGFLISFRISWNIFVLV